jgi:enoyl-CoA hydratase/carnithine racemase
MSDRVTTTILEGGIADVRLNRPDKMNALDGAMFKGIVDAGEALKGNREVRVVVLSGEGRGFCAGLDFSSFQAMAGGGGAPEGDGEADGGGRDAAEVTDGIMSTGDRITHLGQQAAWVWQELEVPVIAAIHGPALGGGIQVALGADLRIVAPDSKLSVLEARWGLIPDMTGTAMLPRLVGLEVAKELTFTGRMVSGEEAVRLGLATKVSEAALDDALAMAAEIAAKSPDAIAGSKRLLNMAGLVPIAEGLAEEARIQGRLVGSPNQVEAVTAYFEQRDAVFQDRD